MLRDMLKKRIKRLLFGNMAKTSDLAKSNLQASTQTSLPCTIHSIDTILLKDYCKLISTKDLNILVVQGEASEAELTERYELIASQYYDLVGGDKQKIYVGLVKQKLQLIRRRNLLVAAFSFYCNNQTKDVKQVLSKLGFHFAEDTHDDKLISLFNAFVTSLDLEVQRRDIDLKKLYPDADGEVANRETYINNIVRMAKEGFKVDFNTDTLEYYAITYKLFVDHLEILQKTHDGKY
jgi:hypothetical protein